MTTALPPESVTAPFWGFWVERTAENRRRGCVESPNAATLAMSVRTFPPLPPASTMREEASVTS